MPARGNDQKIVGKSGITSILLSIKIMIHDQHGHYNSFSFACSHFEGIRKADPRDPSTKSLNNGMSSGRSSPAIIRIRLLNTLMTFGSRTEINSLKPTNQCLITLNQNWPPQLWILTQQSKDSRLPHGSANHSPEKLKTSKKLENLHLYIDQ